MLYKIFLFISLFSLGEANKNPKKMPHNPMHANAQSTFLLEYVGTVTGYMNISVGAQIAMDTSIGFRYDVTFQNGNSVMSHVAFFYKFSSPYQLTEYNYLTHKSFLINTGNAAKGEDLNVVGNENIDTFTCTHLRKTNDHEQQDYWMSKAVPGFAQLAKIIKGIDPNLAMMAIDQTLFNWGGLVKAKVVDVTKGGQETAFNLNLVEATSGLVFTNKDFEVPSH